MTRAIVFILLAPEFMLLAPEALLATAAGGALMPLPLKVTTGKVTPGAGRLAIGSRFGVAGSGCPEPAMARFKARIARQTGIPLGAAGQGMSWQGLAVTCKAPAPDWP